MCNDFHVPQTVPEQMLQCCKMYYPIEMSHSRQVKPDECVCSATMLSGQIYISGGTPGFQTGHRPSLSQMWQAGELVIANTLP